MNEAYVECLVKAKTAKWLVVPKIFLLLVAIYLFFFVVIGNENLYALIIVIPAIVGSYFAHLYKEVEYEYLYLDREIHVDRILARSYRKRIDTISVGRMEVLAPEGSYHLDSYKNKELKVKNYAAPQNSEEQTRYIMICNDGTKILLSLTPQMVKAVKSISPRKVFQD